MSAALLAGFDGPERLLAAARAARQAGRPALDAFTPYPLEGAAEALAVAKPRLPWAMLVGGLAVGAGLYGLQWWSATQGYVLNVGGRPGHSWPAFLIAPVELAIIGAALTGFVLMLRGGGLPRLHHPLFDSLAFERASQDQFVLALPLPADPDARAELRRFAAEHGAAWVEEAEL